MKKKILIINQHQFGYHIDYLQYSKYLKNDFDITFLCWNYNWDLVEECGIDVYYVSREGNIIKRNIRFILEIITLLKKSNFHFTLIHYFRGCSIIPILFNNERIINLDIRTGSVSSNLFQRVFYNYMLYIESLFFKRMSIISESLRNYLRIRKNAYILPLGANIISHQKKLKHKISLLYVGTLANRRIEDTVIGLGVFLEMNPNADVFYTIIGSGWNHEIDTINKLIRMYKLEKYVDLKGYIPYNELISYYEKSNIGVSYIPITTYYNCQPATKTFEYLMAGMPVIATGTYENKKIINKDNGFIINDSPNSFARCIVELNNCISLFDEEMIKNSVSQYKWENIVLKMKDEFILKK